jgi:putative phosphoribosyl transferase
MGTAVMAGSPAPVRIPAGPVRVAGDLAVPDGATGVVVFAHGSGSSRHSLRNHAVAAELTRAGVATLLLDLLTEDEHERDLHTRELRFDSELLALLAAARRPEKVNAIVSRGGRPDLAGANLQTVAAPTLLLVGGADQAVMELNSKALQLLRCESRLEIIPGASHLFEEPGALQQVAELARDWFVDKLERPGEG